MVVANVSVAGRVLQSSKSVDGHHAEHGASVRAAAGQDVSAVRRHQEDEGRLHVSTIHTTTNSNVPITWNRKNIFNLTLKRHVVELLRLNC